MRAPALPAARPAGPGWAPAPGQARRADRPDVRWPSAQVCAAASPLFRGVRVLSARQRPVASAPCDLPGSSPYPVVDRASIIERFGKPWLLGQLDEAAPLVD